MEVPALPLSRPRKTVGAPYLKFQLAQGIPAVLAMQQVAEVMALPVQRLTAMPNMPACILGLMSRRSQVLWVVDLAHLVGISSFDVLPHQYDLIAIQVETIALMLAVQRVGSILWLPEDTIQATPSQVAPNLQTYLQGCVVQEDEILWVLDAAALAHSPLLYRQPGHVTEPSDLVSDVL